LTCKDGHLPRNREATLPFSSSLCIPAGRRGQSENMRAADDLDWRAAPSTISGSELVERANAVAAIAAKHADEVDRAARFPSEAIAAARSERLLGAMLPCELGGEDASIGAIVDVCYTLGRGCASTGLIYAMHQTKVACIFRHARMAPWHERLLHRLGQEQLLFASSTTEGQNGGNIRSSAAAVEHDAARILLERDATVISYGEHADAIVTTARR